MRKEETMYWLPMILAIIGLFVILFWRAGIYGLIFWMAIGIVGLLLYFWSRYWLKKMYETKKKEYY